MNHDCLLKSCISYFSYPTFLFVEFTCCQKIVPASKKARQKLPSDDVFMSEAQDEMMANTHASDSEQWSLFEVLTPLAEKIVQDHVRPC